MVNFKGRHFVVLISRVLLSLINPSSCLDWLPFSPDRLNSTEFYLVSNEVQCSSIVNSSKNMEIDPVFRVDIDLKTYSIPCNRTMKKELLDMGYSEIKARDMSCLPPDNLGCHNDNTVSIVFCFAALFEQKNRYVRPQLYLTNFDNNVTKICNMHQNKENREPEKHGIGASVCVEKFKGEHVVRTFVQLSYAEKSYFLPTKKYPNGRKQRMQQRMSSKKVNSKRISFSFLFGVKNESLATQMLDFNEKVVNLNETISLKRSFPYAPGELFNIVEDNPLAFAFLDMKPSALKNGTTVRPFSLHYDDRIDSQLQVLINGKEQTKLKGVKNEERREKEFKKSCEYLYPEDCVTLKEYKRQICAEMKKCSLNQPPPEIKDRWEVPERLRIKENVDLEKLGKSATFTLCDDMNNLMIDDTTEVTLQNFNIELAKAKACNSNHGRRSTRQINMPESRWDIPIEYTFEKDFDELNDELLDAIDGAIQNIEIETCIRFVYAEVPKADYHMEFVHSEGECFVWGLGKQKNKQINLDTELMGTAVHEITHALGVDHEFERFDRDEYLWCTKGKNNYDDSYGLPYDFSSAMQYQTLIVDDRKYGGTQYYNFIPYERAYQDSLGPDIDSGLSFKDAKLLNKFYCGDKCNKSPVLNCKNGGYQDPNDCTKCRCPRGYSGELCTQLETNDPKICSSSLFEGKFDIVPEKGITKLVGKITGVGSCFWRIQTFASSGNPVNLEEIVVKEVNGLKCPMRIDNLDDCGSNAWIYPCINYLRVQHGKDKTESGARLCCQDSLPLTLTSKTLKHGFGDVLLELKNSGEIGEVSFTLEFSTEPVLLQNSCGCGSPVALLFKPERNPGTTGRPSNNPTKCNNAGVMSDALVCTFKKEEAKTVKIKVNGNELSKNELVDFTSMHLLPAGDDFAYGINIICLTTINNETLPFWAWNRGKEQQLLRIDEIQCY